jgi:zinc transport system ATP-binding protein
LLSSPLKTLSGGELQRVLLTRALLNKPNVLILDEPAQNLDVGGQMQLYKLIQNIHRH